MSDEVKTEQPEIASPAPESLPAEPEVKQEAEDSGNVEKAVDSDDIKVEVTITASTPDTTATPDTAADATPDPAPEPTPAPTPAPTTAPTTVEGISCKVEAADLDYTTKRDGAYKIQFSGNEGDISAMPAISIMEFFDRSVKKFGSRVAMKVERDGKWISWTYNEYLQEIKTAAKGFIKVCKKSKLSF